MTKLSELKAGDVVIADGGFTCMSAGEKIVQRDADSDLYVECREGRHFLDGQLSDDGETLVGLKLKEVHQ